MYSFLLVLSLFGGLFTCFSSALAEETPSQEPDETVVLLLDLSKKMKEDRHQPYGVLTYLFYDVLSISEKKRRIIFTSSAESEEGTPAVWKVIKRPTARRYKSHQKLLRKTVRKVGSFKEFFIRPIMTKLTDEFESSMIHLLWFAEAKPKDTRFPLIPSKLWVTNVRVGDKSPGFPNELRSKVDSHYTPDTRKPLTMSADILATRFGLYTQLIEPGTTKIRIPKEVKRTTLISLNPKRDHSKIWGLGRSGIRDSLRFKDINRYYLRETWTRPIPGKYNVEISQTALLIHEFELSMGKPTALVPQPEQVPEGELYCFEVPIYGHRDNRPDKIILERLDVTLQVQRQTIEGWIDEGEPGRGDDDGSIYQDKVSIAPDKRCFEEQSSTEGSLITQGLRDRKAGDSYYTYCIGKRQRLKHGHTYRVAASLKWGDVTISKKNKVSEPIEVIKPINFEPIDDAIRIKPTQSCSGRVRQSKAYDLQAEEEWDLALCIKNLASKERVRVALDPGAGKILISGAVDGAPAKSTSLDHRQPIQFSAQQRNPSEGEFFGVFVLYSRHPVYSQYLSSRVWGTIVVEPDPERCSRTIQPYVIGSVFILLVILSLLLLFWVSMPDEFQVYLGSTESGMVRQYRSPIRSFTFSDKYGFKIAGEKCSVEMTRDGRYQVTLPFTVKVLSRNDHKSVFCRNLIGHMK